MTWRPKNLWSHLEMLIGQNMFVDIILRSNRLLQKPRGVFGCGGEQQITISFLEQQETNIYNITNWLDWPFPRVNREPR